MLIWTAKVSKVRILSAIALAAGIALAAAMTISSLRNGTLKKSDTPDEIRLESNADRTAYLNALGWEVEPEPVESFSFLLPETLEEPYLSYNALQLPQGFDLGRYCGQETVRYTYTVTNYPGRPTGVQANLYICGTEPIAGDIFCPGANGFQEALIRDIPDTEAAAYANAA